jgi:hypothetical protein
VDRWPASVVRIGARFEDRARALEVMAELRRRFRLHDAAIEVRPLGSTRYDEPSTGVLLAGQFRERDTDAAVELLQQRGGTIVERRTEPDPARVGRSVATLEPPPRGGGESGRRLRR